MMVDTVPPALARRNRNLGLALGALAVAITVFFIIHFTNKGLPEDGDIHRRMHREGRPGHPLGESTETSTIPLAPSIPTVQEESP